MVLETVEKSQETVKVAVAKSFFEKRTAGKTPSPQKSSTNDVVFDFPQGNFRFSSFDIFAAHLEEAILMVVPGTEPVLMDQIPNIMTADKCTDDFITYHGADSALTEKRMLIASQKVSKPIDELF